MAKQLLSVAQRKKFRNAISDVTFSFCDLDATYKRYSNVAKSRFNEDRRPNQAVTEFQLKVLKVEYSDKGASMNQMQNEGEGGIDFGQGYFLCPIEQLKSVGLLDEKEEFTGNSNSDYIVVDGLEMRVVNFAKSGQLKDDPSISQLIGSKDIVGKIFYRKIQKNG